MTRPDGTLSPDGYFRLYERRLLPVFQHVNAEASAEGKSALIIIPGLGCGCFAGPFIGKLGTALQTVLERFLATHGSSFPNIKVVYFDPFDECGNTRFKIHGISLMVRPLLLDNGAKSQLCHPTAYEENDDDFGDCSFFSIVAWDHVSWPGNDFFAGSRCTDDGVKAAATERCREETQAYQQKPADRERKQRETGHQPRGKAPAPPKQAPSLKDQYNFTDPESRIMKTGGGFPQCYNAQAAVEVDSRLIVGGHVTDAPNDKQQLIPALLSITAESGQINTTLVDSGYYSAAAVTDVETNDGPRILAATGRKKHGRTIAELEVREDPPAPPEGAEIAEVMAWCTSTAAGKELYGLRKQTVESVFGIIKEALGFRRFHLRGLAKVNLEWTLVRLAYYIKRLYHLRAMFQVATA